MNDIKSLNGHPIQDEQARQEIATLKTQIANGEASIPSYVPKEAEAVIERVMAAQGSRTFTFAALTDMHYGRLGYTDDFKHAAYALKYINARIGLDAFAVLGDYTDIRPSEGIENVLEDFKEVNLALDDMRHIPNLRVSGNHDYWDAHAAQLFRYTGSISDGEVWQSAGSGNYYRDFTRVSLRVIVLNLAGDEIGNIQENAALAQWFADAIDLSTKTDAAQWQILVLSHQPVDYWRTSDSINYAIPKIIEAYISGGSYSADGVSCDYSGKNAAKFIGNIHGHLHNLLVDKIYRGECSVSTQIEALRICTPESVSGRTGGNESVWEAATNYEKQQNTSWDTAFVIYSIDLDAKTIDATCYGAGVHRTIDYSALSYSTTEKGIFYPDSTKPTEPATYTNQIPIATDESGATVSNGMMYANMRWSYSTGNLSAAEGHWISGFIPAKVGDMIRVRWNNKHTQASGYISLRAFDASKQALVGAFSFNRMNTPEYEGLDFQNAPGYSFDYANGIVDFTIPECGYTPAGMAYIAFCLAGDASEAIVTVNEEIA